MNERRRNITFISHDAHLHGATRSLIDIADLIRDQNFDSTMVIPQEGLIGNVLREKNLPYRKVFFPLLVSFNQKEGLRAEWKRLLSAIRNFKYLLNNVKVTSPDVVYINTVANYWTLILRNFVSAKFIWHIREFGEPDHKMYFDFRGVLFKLLKNKADLVIVNSVSVQDYFKRKFNINSSVIYNGVLLKEKFDQNFLIRQAYKSSINSTELIIGIVGNISPGKGQLELVKALADVLRNDSNIKLVIVGDGKNRRVIQDFIEENKLGNSVQITGFTHDTELYYKTFDIVVVNSVLEAFGRVTIEAASYGIVVVGRNTGATAEIIKHMDTGMLHDGSIKDLGDKVMELAYNPELREKIGKRGWENAKGLYSLDDHIPKIKKSILDLYTK